MLVIREKRAHVMKSIRAAWRPTVLLVVVALTAAPIRAADSPSASTSLPGWSAACSRGQGRLLLLDNTGGGKELGQTLARALAGRAAAPAAQPSVEVRTPPNAALAAVWAARDKPPRADLVVVHLAPTSPTTRQGLDDYAASCAHLARELARSGGDVLLLAPSACGSWAAPEVCAALRTALEEDSLSAVVAGADEVLADGAADKGQAASLLLGATAEWTTRGLAARLTVGGKPGQAQRGSLTVRAFAQATVEPSGSLEFDLAPGKTESFLLLFPAFRRPDVAVSDARLRGAVADGPLDLLVRCGAGGGERHVRAYFDPLMVWAQRSREVISQYRLPLHLRVRNARAAPLMAEVKAMLPGWATARPVREMLALPARSTTSSPPLQMPLPAAAIGGPVQVVVELCGQGCNPVHALAEADLLRAGQCANLERAAVDGELGEWDGRLFARLAGPRESSRRLEFTTGWDADHVYVAVRAGGAEPAGQKLGLVIDARAGRRLGTPGGGVYVHVVLEADGAVRAIRPGSEEKLPVGGAWKGDEQGWRLELALPRTLLGAPAWSEQETDIGFNLAWLADSPDAATLIWSGGGEEGSSRACGLLRRSTSLTVRPSLRELPLLVRWR